MKSKKPKEIENKVITTKEGLNILVSNKWENINKSEEKQWKEIQKELKEISTPKDKLILLHTKLAEYYQNLPVPTMAASGIITNEYKNLGKLFLDRKITAEIELIKALIDSEESEKKRNTEENFGFSLTYKEETERIFNIGQRYLLLKETGFMETPNMKGSEFYTQESKQNLISHILKCDIRTAKGFLLNETRFIPSAKLSLAVRDYIKRIKRK